MEAKPVLTNLCGAEKWCAILKVTKVVHSEVRIATKIHFTHLRTQTLSLRTWGTQTHFKLMAPSI